MFNEDLACVAGGFCWGSEHAERAAKPRGETPIPPGGFAARSLTLTPTESPATQANMDFEDCRFWGIRIRLGPI